jgi:hypothetical protein
MAEVLPGRIPEKVPIALVNRLVETQLSHKRSVDLLSVSGVSEVLGA